LFQIEPAAVAALARAGTPNTSEQQCRELANLVAAAFVLGQFIGERPLAWGLVVLGFLTWPASSGMVSR
jgi:hypothetical protein